MVLTIYSFYNDMDGNAQQTYHQPNSIYTRHLVTIKLERQIQGTDFLETNCLTTLQLANTFLILGNIY